ncbi:gfo/Idh/MocA family oxidoreductase [bacterium]|nr:gfo/Idh/MocA family oxidoreductase [bacterium]
MAKQDIGVAVVGAGLIGPVHAEALRRLGLNMKGILGCDADESESARKALGLAKAYTNYEELLADAEVHSVHLCVPNVLHYEMTKQAIYAGKHVICEKPLAMNSKQTAELAELAKRKNLACGVGYNVRFYPVNLEAKEMVRQGKTGEIMHVNGSYVQDWLFYDTDYNWRVLADQGGELRAVADIGTHWMDLVQNITGLEIDSVFADLYTVHTTRKRPKGEVETFSGKLSTEADLEPIPITTDDYGAVLFRFKNGGRGTLYVSQVTAGRKNCIRYEISGSQCTLAWNSESPNDLWIGRRSEPNQALMRDPSLVSDSVRKYINYPGGHNEGFPDTFKQLFRAFYDYIEQGDFSAEPPFPTFASGHKKVVLCEAIIKSHREERWIPL